MGAANAITTFNGDDGGGGSIGDHGKRVGDGGPKLHM
jgi:hypothetical protein